MRKYVGLCVRHLNHSAYTISNFDKIMQNANKRTVDAGIYNDMLLDFVDELVDGSVGV